MKKIGLAAGILFLFLVPIAFSPAGLPADIVITPDMWGTGTAAPVALESSADFVAAIIKPDIAGTTSFKAGEDILFEGGFIGESSAEKWEWDFGDGSSHATTQNASHKYSIVGNYSAKLTVTSGGKQQTATILLQITESGSPVATASSVVEGLAQIDKRLVDGIFEK